eukprot:SAG31_NODE_906_length_11091_cov_22.589065_9_plen_47_part_00
MTVTAVVHDNPEIRLALCIAWHGAAHRAAIAAQCRLAGGGTGAAIN